MITFEDREAVGEWLDPLDYEAFWRDTAELDIDLPGRTECDDSIAGGNDPAALLYVLKGLVRLHIVKAQGLRSRITTRRLH